MGGVGGRSPQQFARPLITSRSRIASRRPHLPRHSPPVIQCGKHLTRPPVPRGQRNDMPNSVIIIVGLVVLATLFLASLLAKMFRKAGPNEAIIVYGFRGPRVIKGGGAVIFPVVENSRQLSLELMSFDVAPQQDLYTKQGVAVTVEAVAQ